MFSKVLYWQACIDNVLVIIIAAVLAMTMGQLALEVGESVSRYREQKKLPRIFCN